MKNILFKILNSLPIFHVSTDENFGTYSDITTTRFSLIVVAFGNVKLYFLTFSRGDGFRLSKILQLEALLDKKLQAEIDQKTLDYAQFISNQGNPELETQYEFLKERHNNNMTAKSSLESRMSAYMTLYFAVIGFAVYLFNETLKIDSKPIFYIALVGCAVSTLFLLSAYIHSWTFLRVKVVVRAAFRDLKAAPSKAKQAELAYTNWFASKDEIRVLASYVKCFENNLTKGAALAILTWIFVALSPTMFSTTAAVSLEAMDGEFEIFDHDGKLQRAQLVKLAENLQEVSSQYRYYVLAGVNADKVHLDQVVNLIALWDQKAPADVFKVTSKLGSTIIVQKKRMQK